MDGVKGCNGANNHVYSRLALSWLPNYKRIDGKNTEAVWSVHWSMHAIEKAINVEKTWDAGTTSRRQRAKRLFPHLGLQATSCQEQD